jgi:cellulose biosynthesis protein BcsQ
VALLTIWSSKGGSGTSVFTAAGALVLARGPGVRLVDLGGDQPAIFGLGAEPRTGVLDWLEAGPGAPTDGLDRLAIEAAPGVALIPRGEEPTALAPRPAAEAGAALAVALRDGPTPTLVDAGTADAPAARALLEVSDATILVVRGCYLALRRSVRHPALARAAGIVVLEEPGRAIGAREIADVLGRPVIARVPSRDSVARAVDAGVLAHRLPDVLARPAETALRAVGLLWDQRGAVA